MASGATDHEYQGMIATYWDLLRGDTSQWADGAFYRELLLEAGQPALDVGCGTGRLLLPYLEQEIDVEGVEVSPEMIAMCRRAAADRGLDPTIHQVAMQNLKLERRYRTVLVPSSSFQLLTDRDDARMAMRRFFEHLEPGGRLAMPFMVFWREGRRLEEPWHVISEAELPEQGTRIRRWGMATNDAEARLQHTRDRYEVLEEDEVVMTENHERSPAARWYSLEEAVDLYRATGFEDVRATRKFSCEPAVTTDDLFVVVGKRPADVPLM